MNATTPPRRCASARTCWQSVVLPDDSGPKISVIRPRGMPPTPSARSSAMEPVGMASTCCRSDEPSFMIEPRPNCFSMDRMAASTALPRSATSAPPRGPCCRVRAVAASVPVWPGPRDGHAWSPPRLRTEGPCDQDRGYSSLVFLLRPRLPLGLDELHGLRRRIEQRLELGLADCGLRLLLGFAAGGDSACHGRRASTWRRPVWAARLHGRLHAFIRWTLRGPVPACVSRSIRSVAGCVDGSPTCPLIADQLGEGPGARCAPGSRP